MLICQGSQMAGPPIHGFLAFCFNHDAQHGLCAAGPDEDTTGVSHAGFRGMDGFNKRFTPGPALAPRPVGHRDIHKFLGISLETAIHPVIETDPLAVAKGGELQGCQDPITTETMGRGKDVTGLLTAQGCAVGHHGRMNVLIPNRSAFEHTTSALPGPFKAEVGHHRGNQTLIGQGLAILEHGSPEEQHVVAIDHASTGIDRQHPVGVTIKRKSHGGSTLKHGLTEGLKLGGTTVHIDPLTIGLAMEDRQVGAEGKKGLGATGCGRSPAQIEHDRNSIEPQSSNRCQKGILISLQQIIALAAHAAADNGAVL